MKILFITAFPPCQKTAGQDYFRRLILDLLEKGHEVTLIYAEYPGHTVELPDSAKVLSIIHPAFKNCLVKPYFHPFFTRRFDKSVLNLLQTVSADYDMLYFDFSGKDVVKNRFCFYGAWNRAENTEALEWFLSHVYPKLSCDAHFIVIGGGVSEALLNEISTYKNFSCLGFVDDPVKEIACCQALIAPLHKGAGVKVKVIDALSSGSAVIGTDVAFEGIEDNAKHPLFFSADSPDEFADILNKWQPLTLSEKQAATDEFFARYNSNHFADVLSFA